MATVEQEQYLDENELVREICRESFYHFVLEFWDVVNPGVEMVDNWHIKFLCSVAQRACERVFNGEEREGDIVVNIPPGESKSTIFSIMLTPWAWTRMPHCRFLCAAHAYSLVMTLSRKSRDIVQCKKYRTLFPEIQLRKDQNTKLEFENTLGGTRFCCTVAGISPIGRHSHVQIVDDPLDPKTATSDAGLKEANHFMTATLPSRRINQRVTVMMLIMQRLNEIDPAGELLKNDAIKKLHYCLPAEVSDNVKPAWVKKYYRQNGGLLDPERLPKVVLEDMLARMGEYDYAGQYGQRPVPLGGGIFRIGKIRYVDQALMDKEYADIVRFWDKAATQDAGCRTAGVKMAARIIGHTPLIPGTRGYPAIQPRPIYEYWVLDVKTGQWGTDEREELMRSTAELDGRNVRVGLEREGGSGGKHSAEFTVGNLAGWNVESELPTGEKLVRARPFASQVNIGRVVLVRAPWNMLYVSELEYAGRGQYFDQIDASSGCFRMLTEGPVRIGVFK
jgi:predicted phage terminase large subunit-like protein